MLPRLVLPESVSAVPAVAAAWKLSVATVLPPASCTKQPKATPCAAKVTDTLPEVSAEPEPATGGDPNVTQKSLYPASGPLRALSITPEAWCVTVPDSSCPVMVTLLGVLS